MYLADVYIVLWQRAVFKARMRNHLNISGGSEKYHNHNLFWIHNFLEKAEYSLVIFTVNFQWDKTKIEMSHHKGYFLKFFGLFVIQYFDILSTKWLIKKIIGTQGKSSGCCTHFSINLTEKNFDWRSICQKGDFHVLLKCEPVLKQLLYILTTCTFTNFLQFQMLSLLLLMVIDQSSVTDQRERRILSMLQNEVCKRWSPLYLYSEQVQGCTCTYTICIMLLGFCWQW